MAFSQAKSNNGLREGKTAGENFWVVDLRHLDGLMKNEERRDGPVSGRTAIEV
ncbi:MAG: hypothetical protein HYY45_21365 [Deltaproteobacteria bacterium]|nr:hypothetical protein [Deltaproteobacteria bacterium]